VETQTTAEVNTTSQNYHFWQRNSLPITLYSADVFIQKMNYLHYNPTVEKWNLADLPENYKYSSAKFYLEGIDEFGFLTHWQE
jgi:putative transposase